MTPPIQLTFFSANITLLRTVHGYTQSQIAKEFGIGRTAVSNWEKGVAYPQFTDAVRLANLHGVTLDQLVMPTRDLEKWLLDDQREGLSMHRIPKQQREMLQRVEKHLSKNKAPDVEALASVVEKLSKEVAELREQKRAVSPKRRKAG